MDPQHIATFKRVRTSEYLTVEEYYQKLNKFIEDYEAVKSSLTLLSEKCKHPVMVPFGNMAFMSGTLVHTNDVLVLLGDNWFVEQSAKQTIEILNRRIAALRTQTDNLQARMQQIKTELGYARELVEESGDTVEIVEPYDEQSEQNWKTQHDANVRKYHQESKKSSTFDSSDSSTSSERLEYEQILQRLEQLEKAEADDADNHVEEDEDKVHPSGESVVQEPDSDSDDDLENTCEPGLPLVINFKHSVMESEMRGRCTAVLSPAVIYDKFCAQYSSTTSDVVETYLDQSGQTQHSQDQDVSSEMLESRSRPESHLVVCHDSEMPRSSVAIDKRSSAADPTVRKVSKFKASRLKK